MTIKWPTDEEIEAFEMESNLSATIIRNDDVMVLVADIGNYQIGPADLLRLIRDAYNRGEIETDEIDGNPPIVIARYNPRHR